MLSGLMRSRSRNTTEVSRSRIGGFELFSIFHIILMALSIFILKWEKHSSAKIKNIGDIQMDQLMPFLLITASEDRKWAYEARLYSIAGMYGMTDLKNRVSVRLQSSITISNAWMTFVLADTYEDQKLKEEAELFLRTHAKETLFSEGWKEEMQSMMINATFQYS